MRKITASLVIAALGVTSLVPLAQAQQDAGPAQVSANLDCTIKFDPASAVPARAQGRFLESTGYTFPATVAVEAPATATQGRSATYRIASATVSIPKVLNYKKSGWLGPDSYTFRVEEVTNARFRFAGLPATGATAAGAQAVTAQNILKIQGESPADSGTNPGAFSPGPITAAYEGGHLVATAPAVDVALDTATAGTITPHIPGKDISSWWYATSHLNAEDAFFTSLARITYISTLQEVTETAFLRCTPKERINLSAATVQPAQPQHLTSITAELSRPWLRLGETVTVTGQALDIDGQPIAGTELEVAAGPIRQTVTTDDTGTYRLEVTPTTAGWHPITVTNRQFVESRQLNLTVHEAPADIFFRVPESLQVGEHQYAHVEVHNAQGQTLADPEFRVTVNGQPPAGGPDANGPWLVLLPTDQPGDIVLRAWVGEYLAKEVVIPVRPIPAAALTLTSAEVPGGVEFTVVATTADGSPAAGVPVQIQVGDTTHTVTTNAEGIGVLTLPSPDGLYTVVATSGEVTSPAVNVGENPAPPTDTQPPSTSAQPTEPEQPTPPAGGSSLDWRALLLVVAGLGGIIAVICHHLGILR